MVKRELFNYLIIRCDVKNGPISIGFISGARVTCGENHHNGGQSYIFLEILVGLSKKNIDVTPFCVSEASYLVIPYYDGSYVVPICVNPASELILALVVHSQLLSLLLGLLRSRRSINQFILLLD